MSEWVPELTEAEEVELLSIFQEIWGGGGQQEGDAESSQLFKNVYGRCFSMFAVHRYNPAKWSKLIMWVRLSPNVTFLPLSLLHS